MLDRIEILVEEPSMVEVLKALLPQIMPDKWILNDNYFIRPHEGKSDLKRSIPRKIKAFSKWKDCNIGFIILQDQDSNNCKQLKQELQALCQQCAGPNIQYLIRIVCHELEAWYLGDPDAIERVFPRFHAAQYKTKKICKDPDGCTNPKRELKKIVGEYPQIQTARSMGEVLKSNFQNNKSTSLQQLISGVIRFVS